MEANQGEPWPCLQRRQALHELQHRHHQVRGADAPGCLELEHHLPGCVGLNALVGQCRTGDGAAQSRQRLAVIGGAAHSGMQVETVEIGAQRLLEVLLHGHGALQRQNLLAGARTEGDAASARRRLQRPEDVGLISTAVVVGHAGRALLFDQPPDG